MAEQNYFYFTGLGCQLRITALGFSVVRSFFHGPFPIWFSAYLLDPADRAKSLITKRCQKTSRRSQKPDEKDCTEEPCIFGSFS